MYKIMFYGGMAGTIFMLVITVFIFIKGNVLEDIKDLLGIKSTKKTLNKISLNNTTSNIKAVTTNAEIITNHIMKLVAPKKSFFSFI